MAKGPNVGSLTPRMLHTGSVSPRVAGTTWVGDGAAGLVEGIGVQQGGGKQGDGGMAR